MSKPVALEDEVFIRMNAVAMIEDAGPEVIEAIGADEAILILEARPDIRVVFTDIEMPGSMNGLKLVHCIRNRWPPVVLIVASGRLTPKPDEMPTETVFLQKPYRDDALLAVLADAH